MDQYLTNRFDRFIEAQDDDPHLLTIVSWDDDLIGVNSKRTREMNINRVLSLSFVFVEPTSLF